MEITKASRLQTASCRTFEHCGVPSICHSCQWWFGRWSSSAPNVLGACRSRTQPPESIRQFPDKLCSTMSKCRDPQSKRSGKHFMARCVCEQECDEAAVFLLHRAARGVRGVTPKAAAGSSHGRTKSVFPSHLSSTAQLPSASSCGGCWGGCSFFSPRR